MMVNPLREIHPGRDCLHGPTNAFAIPVFASNGRAGEQSQGDRQIREDAFVHVICVEVDHIRNQSRRCNLLQRFAENGIQKVMADLETLTSACRRAIANGDAKRPFDEA